MALLIAGMMFFAMLLVFILIYKHWLVEKQDVHDRMAKIGQYTSAGVQVEPETGIKKPHSNSKQPAAWFAVVRQISKYFERPALSRKIEHKLIQAGIPMRGSEFLVIWMGTALLGGTTLFLLSGFKLVPGIVGTALGAGIPPVILRLKISRRTKAFNDQLGDALMLIANSLRTGYSFMQAIDMASKEMPEPIGSEFAKTLKEMNLGVTTEDALNNLAKRVDSDDLDLVVTAVLIQRQVGGNLAEVLNNIADTIRQRVKIKGQIKTLTAQGRVSGIVVSLLPLGIGTIIYALNPEYISILFTHPVGKMMLALGVVSQLLGIMIIRKIVDIEV